jgi:UDP-2-acetamido-3-amino-2,3-dideoxy-glucuronate N-acetyltransferase
MNPFMTMIPRNRHHRRWRTIGPGARIWHWTHVCAGAVIGENCSLGQNVFVGNRVVIGSNVKIQNNVSIYDDVTLEDDVFCGPSMVFTNVYNPRSAISRKDGIPPTLVQTGATLGPTAPSSAASPSAVCLYRRRAPW